MSGRLSRAVIAFAAGITGVSAPAASSVPRPANPCLAYAPKAAERSGLPQDIIVRVMMAESGGQPHAVSPKGAIGCMQIMPATWTYLSVRYQIGPDPFDARMNMIGGALYLAELARQFGMPGAFAAYNAGPARYLRFVANGRPLPAETIAYAGRLGGAGAPAIATPAQPRWQEAALFMARGGERFPVIASPAPSAIAASPSPDDLFVIGPGR